MNIEQAIPYVGYVVDDASCGRALGDDDSCAVIREGGDDSLPSRERKGFQYASRLVGWQCGFEPMFVAVHSYLDVPVTDEEAIELATDYLKEIGWFSGLPTEPDFIL